MGILQEERILITTFDTWQPHQVSNASDDLLLRLEDQKALPEGCRVLHRLPVCTETAYALIEAELGQASLDYVICCGVAESRYLLNLEAQAHREQEVLQTPIALTELCSTRRELRRTEISYDAGQFVCNEIYYVLLWRFWAIAKQITSGPLPNPTLHHCLSMCPPHS
ncbi:MAG: peptidase C15 [Synechococcales cyanobacterium RU_4_20]|nr:peptidase C15 [Synechococcales cyanobacterium RU_4_20]